MKKLFSLLTILSVVTTFTFAQEKSTAPTPIGQVIELQEEASGAIMTFEATEVNYGVIDQGSDPLRKFHFTNTGTEPLVIKNAKGSCGCTVPKYPKEPILPGESSVIEVRYDTKRIGKFTKRVTLTTNEGSEKRVLTIKGEVNKPPVEPAGVPASTPSIFTPQGN